VIEKRNMRKEIPRKNGEMKAEKGQNRTKGYKKSIAYCLGLLWACLVLVVPLARAQADQPETASQKERVPKVFIDWEGADLELLGKEIAFVQFVQDLAEAQVDVRVSSRETGTGEREYTISFTGRGKFEGDNDELTYLTEKGRPGDAVRQDLIRKIELGLMRYVGKTPAAGRISIALMGEVEPTAVEDKWDFWVFSLSADTYMNGEESYEDSLFSGSFSAIRVTPELKVRFSVSSYFERSEYKIDEEVIKSHSESHNLNGLIVKSIDEHWSVGAFFSVLSSTYSNIQFRINPAPAIEYNLFPYSESTKKQLRFLYRLGYNSVRYREETIYGKTYQNLWQQVLSVTLELKQKWGTASTSIEGSNYFHDLEKNRLQLSGELSLRLVKGLNFNLYGSYSRIRDQLSLPKGEASLEEVLLQLRQLETGYSYYLSVGLSYSFGSTQSKVVNPRFGTGGTSISISF
jgi:hypothetical protein